MTSFHKSGPLGVITIEHGALNLFDYELFEALEAAVTEAELTAPRALLSAPRARSSAGVSTWVASSTG